MSFGNFDSWDDAETSQDFFSELNNETATDETSAEEVIKQITEEEEIEDETVHQPVEDLFENEEEESSDLPGDHEEEEVVSTNITVLNSLKEKGFLDFELQDEEELTEELAEELLEDKFEEAIEERIKDKLTELPDDAQQIIQFVLKGGSLNEYLKQVSSTSTGKIKEDLDLSAEENQVTVIRELLASEDFDEETIETQIELLKDSGKLQSFAEKKYEKWLSDNKVKKQKLLKDQEEKRKELKDSIRESKRRISETLSQVEDIGGLEASKEDKRVIPSYINDRTVKLQHGGEISEMQKDLFYELPKNEKAMIQLAILLRNRNSDGTFNFDNIEGKIKTKVTKDLKQNIRRSKTTIPKSSSKSNSEGRALADYFK